MNHPFAFTQNPKHRNPLSYEMGFL